MTGKAKRPSKALVKGPVKPTAPTFVHVASMTLRKNRLTAPEKRQPPVVFRRGRSGSPVRAYRVDILDKDGRVAATVEYTPDRPLSCGAVVFVTCPYGVVAVPDATAPQSVCAGS